jgi:hypothetical protein
MAKDAPKSGAGSNADRISQSPLSIRRGGADPTEVDDSPLNLDFSERGYDDNPRQPLPPIEPGGAVPPAEAPKSWHVRTRRWSTVAGQRSTPPKGRASRRLARAWLFSALGRYWKHMAAP